MSTWQIILVAAGVLYGLAYAAKLSWEAWQTLSGIVAWEDERREAHE